MKITKFLTGVVKNVVVIAVLFVTTALYSAVQPEVYTRSTYHCLSLYWNSPNLGACKVEYKPAGTATWELGQNLPYDSVTGTPIQNQYRGSLVNLKPGTTYDVRLTAGKTVKTVTASTRTENFKIKKVIKVGNLTKTFTTTESGSEADGYVVYDGTGSTIDSNFSSAFGISVKHSYIIIRGFKIQRCTNHGIFIYGNYHDVIIENCEITNWGARQNYPAQYNISTRATGIMVTPEAKRVTIQRCSIHHPRYPASRWHQVPGNDHPFGAKAIGIGNSDKMLPWEANHVIRYNSCYTDMAHAFEDVMNGYPNYGKSGFPGADSDIYCNLVQNGTDDLIEADGGGQNVRIWGNYLDGCTAGISLQSCTVGPTYVFRNIFVSGGLMFKFAGNNLDWSGKKGSPHALFYGPAYVYHNTSIASGGGGFSQAFRTCPKDDSRYIISRNNVLMTKGNYVSNPFHTVPGHPRFVNCSFDYDLHNRTSNFQGDQGVDYDKHGFLANVTWRAGSGTANPNNGKYQLALGSKGYNNGVYLPNFNLGTGEEGKAPDMGANEYNSADMVFGPKANWAPLKAGGGGGPAVPASPSGLSAIATSSTQISLSWTDNADNETGYKIERRTGIVGTYAQIATVGVGIKAYSNTGLKPGSEYYYRVRATNAVGDSGYSNEASAITQGLTPAAPSGLTIAVVSSSQLNLKWTNNSNNETGFKIERKTGVNGVYKQIKQTSAGVVKYSNTGLKPGTRYYYRVRATNAAGDSAYSNEVNASTKALTVLITSPNTAKSTVGSQFIYQITESIEGGGIGVSSDTTSYGAAGLPLGLSLNPTTGLISGTVDTAGVYSVALSASNVGGAGTLVLNVTIQTASLAAPTNLIAAVSGSTVSLTWSDNSSDESSFRVWRKEGVDGTWGYIGHVKTDSTGYIDTKCISGKAYFYRVGGRKDDEMARYYSPLSNEASATLP